MTSLESDFEEKLLLVKNNYLKSLNEKYNILNALKDSIFKAESLNDESSIKAFQEAYGYIHKLSGSSALFGFYELGQTSNKLELLLKEFIENGCLLDKQIIFEHFDILLNELEKAIK